MEILGDFESCYNMNWRANTEIGYDPKKQCYKMVLL